MDEMKEISKKQRFLEMVESIEVPSRQSMKISEMVALVEGYSQFEVVMYAFNYGFKRGANYGKKHKK